MESPRRCWFGLLSSFAATVATCVLVAAQDPVILFDEANFQGPSLPIDRSIPDLHHIAQRCGAHSFATCTTSIRVPEGWAIRIFELPWYRGRSAVFLADVATLADVHGPCPPGVGGNFNGCVASIELRSFRPQRTLVISSQEAWQDTGVDVKAGDHLTILASGVARFADGEYLATPDGPLERLLDALMSPCTRLVCSDGIPSHSLVGRVGDDRLDDSRSGFFVGSTYEARALSSGRLFLGFNDGFVRPDRKGLSAGGVADNHGWFLVGVEVASAKSVWTRDQRSDPSPGGVVRSRAERFERARAAVTSDARSPGSVNR